MPSRFSLTKIIAQHCVLLTCGAMSADILPNQLNNEISQLGSQYTNEQGLIIRRIAAFLDDKDEYLGEREIKKFLTAYPDSPLCEQLHSILGDLYVKNSLYEEALSQYANIQSEEYAAKIIVNKLQCHYQLSQYDEVISNGSLYTSGLKQIQANQKDQLSFLVGEGYFRAATLTSNKAKANEYAQLAIPLYESLTGSIYAHHIALPLAESYLSVNDYEKAASQFLKAANTQEKNQEEILSQCALAQSEFNTEAAIATLNRVIDMKGPLQKDAIVNRMILFFRDEKHDVVLNNISDVALVKGHEKEQMIHYIVGRSSFALNELALADEYLSSFIEKETSPSPQLKNALIMHLTSLQDTDQVEKANASMALLKRHFIQADVYSQALFMHARMMKKLGHTVIAESEYTELLSDREFAHKEELYFELGCTAHANSNFKNCYDALSTYVSVYPNGDNSDQAHKLLFSAALKKLESDNEYGKAAFYKDLRKVACAHSVSNKIFSDQELRDCRMLSAKTAYELEKYTDAMQQLTSIIADYPSNQELAEAHLILGICSQNVDEDPAQFYQNMAKALSLDPKIANTPTLHLQLYNAYLSKAELILQKNAKETVSDTTIASLHKSAAEHLYQAIMSNCSEVKDKNIHWLAQTYFKSESEKDINRALSLYAMILEKDNKLISPQDNLADKEHLVLEYTSLLTKRNEHEKAKKILSELVEYQSTTDNVWNNKVEALGCLAEAYEQLGEKSDAVDTYAHMLSSYKDTHCHAIDKATIQYCKLVMDSMEQEYINPRNTAIISMLSDLKNVQIQKVTSNDALHFQAALVYAKIRAQISESHLRDEEYAFYLSRIQSDYRALNDCLVEQYYKSIADNSQLQQVHAACMKYLNAEILRAQAVIEHQHNNSNDAIALDLEAQTLFNELNSSDSVPKFIQEKAIEKVM